MPFVDAVLSYHTNPLCCGVAKFSQQLAERLGVPWGSWMTTAEHPLLSVKFGEIDEQLWLHPRNHYDVFLHDAPVRDREWACVLAATNVYAADGQIAKAVQQRRPDTVTAFCPSTIRGNPVVGAYRVLAFGMAHKIVLGEFRKLKLELDRDHPDYTVELSTGVHEGNPWDQSMQESTVALREIFGDRLRVLGFLADDALARVLQECDAVAAFYVPALRANNTTAWAALAAGKFLYTNLDEHSPALDVKAHSWEKLLELMR